MRHQSAQGVQLRRHLKELEPAIEFLQSVYGYCAKIPHHMLVNLTVLQDEKSTHTCQERNYIY